MIATSWAIKREADKTQMSEKDIPEQYKDYADVFSEEKAKRFPLAREEDHQIKFTNDVPKYFKGDVYSLTINQTAFLRKWLDEELIKQFI
jgi:primase-polymerase (primpol)-like protein